MAPEAAQPDHRDDIPDVVRLTPQSDLTWLLHRAAQRLRSVAGEQAQTRGIQLRDYIVLSALSVDAGLTQAELGAALGLDKTTLMAQLDRLEKRGLVVRRRDPADRRLRIPDATGTGRAIAAEVAHACEIAEQQLLASYSATEQTRLREMLFGLVDGVQDPGSCL